MDWKFRQLDAGTPLRFASNAMLHELPAADLLANHRRDAVENLIEATDLPYPAIFLSRSSGVVAAQAPSVLDKVSAGLFWKGRFFDGLRIVDATGQAHEVVSAYVRKPESEFGQWLARLFDLPISVHAATRAVGAVSLAELVRAVEKWIQDDPQLFEEQSGYDIASAKASLSKCTNVEDVAKFLSSEKYDG